MEDTTTRIFLNTRREALKCNIALYNCVHYVKYSHSFSFILHHLIVLSPIFSYNSLLSTIAYLHGERLGLAPQPQPDDFSCFSPLHSPLPFTLLPSKSSQNGLQERVIRDLPHSLP